MIFAPEASVIELPTRPASNNCFAFMAAALGLDYWVVPQLTAPFPGHYVPTAEGVAALQTAVKHVLLARGLRHLLLEPREL